MTEKIRALIESGRARATDRNDDGITPLHLAANNGHFEACDYLIKKGADINVNLAGTPLHWAIWAGRMDPVNLKIIELLIKHGANPRILDNQGYNHETLKRARCSHTRSIARDLECVITCYRNLRHYTHAVECLVGSEALKIRRTDATAPMNHAEPRITHQPISVIAIFHIACASTLL